LVAGAGTPLAEISAALSDEGQRLAFEPVDCRGLQGTSGEPTLGGAVATNASGPRRITAGACRDFLLGVRFVDGSGTVLKNGGRVMKNVTGYDLVKLMAGSYGTLGILTELSLKVLPTPETEATLCVCATDAVAAVKTMSAALSSPFEVSGAAYDPAAGFVYLRLEGFEASVAYRIGRLIDRLSDYGDTHVKTGQTSAPHWQEIRDVACFHDEPGDIWRLSVKPTEAPEIAARAEADGTLFDWGGGLIWLRVDSETDLRSRLGSFSGHATLMRASSETRARFGMFHPDPAPLAAITQGLRDKFDPRGVLNPGLMR
ncbi:MAG: FAD-binding protein, partial [Pseudomonadota bacterium]